MPSLTDSNLVFRALIMLGLIFFGFYLAFDQGMLELMLTSDRSYISYVIIGLYLIASVHWFWLSRALGIERSQFSALEQNLAADTTAPEDAQDGQDANDHHPQTSVREHSLVGGFLKNWQNKVAVSTTNCSMISTISSTQLFLLIFSTTSPSLIWTAADVT